MNTLMGDRSNGPISSIVVIQKMGKGSLGTYLEIGYQLYYSTHDVHVMICRSCDNYFAVSNVDFYSEQ